MNRKLDPGKPALTPALSPGDLGRFGCERNRLTGSHLNDSLAVRSGAGTPAGVPEAAGLDSGGIAALNHRLQAGIPPG